MRRKRIPKKPNFAALKVVDSSVAYKEGKDGVYRLKSSVFGIINKNELVIYRKVLDRKTKLYKRRYINDYVNLTDKLKNDLFDFWDKNTNIKRNKAYLMEKE